MSEENKKQLQHVLQTLDLIEIHGKENMDMLLGCILTLEKLVKEDNPNGGSFRENDQ